MNPIPNFKTGLLYPQSQRILTEENPESWIKAKVEEIMELSQQIKEGRRPDMLLDKSIQEKLLELINGAPLGSLKEDSIKKNKRALF